MLATHLGLNGGERKEQLQDLCAMLAKPACAALLMGDFNVWPSGAVPLPLAARGFHQAAMPSFPTRPFPFIALDRILARPPGAPRPRLVSRKRVVEARVRPLPGARRIL